MVDHQTRLMLSRFSQIRKHLKLEKKVSLRLCSERPWYDHYTGGHTVPKHRAVPRDDSSSEYLWGTTLRYCPKLGYKKDEEDLEEVD